MNQRSAHRVLCTMDEGIRMPKPIKFPVLNSLLFGVILGFSLTPALALGQMVATTASEVTGEYQLNVSPPLADSTDTKPAKLTIPLSVNGKLVTRTVEIKNIQKWVPSATRPMTRSQWVTIIERRDEAAQAKAKAIVEAINTSFAQEFEVLKEKARATTFAPEFPKLKLGQDPYVGIGIYDFFEREKAPLPHSTWGAIIIPGLPQQGKDQVVRVTGEDTKELSDGMFQERKRTASAGSSGGMGRAIPGVVPKASGSDALGDLSVVQIGIQEEYVATLTPTPGMTDEDVLLALESSLESQGIPVSFDSSSATLYLGVPEGQTFEWGNSDTGLEFQTSYSTAKFPQCPPIGLASGCQVLITVNKDDSLSISVDPDQGPLDHPAGHGGDDALVGVQNNSSSPVLSVILSGPGAFAFDNKILLSPDGLCGKLISPKPTNCPFGPTSYEGPSTSFTVVNSNDGIVSFLNGGIKPGKSAYFSLEHPPVAGLAQALTSPTATTAAAFASPNDRLGERLAASNRSQ